VKIEIISATRNSEKDFWTRSALGVSLKRIPFEDVPISRITFNNKKGLPVIYNEGIEKGQEDSLLAFIHDDVWIEDYFFPQRIVEGLNRYDVIGLAGNRRRINGQPSWAFINQSFVWDDGQNLTGAVAHGRHPFGPVSFFGKTPAECEFLDGLFLAAKRSSLVKANCYFDSVFNFNFYDMDFCRTARKAGLVLGTWPICVTHQSGGGFGTENWKRDYKAYMEKWKE
jgi:GT2 family glycosyltransferase